MRRQIPWNPKRAARRSGLFRLLADSQAGFTIIEVVVSAVLVASIGGATASALISTSSFSGDQRRRSQGDEIAQLDQERMRGMSIKALSGLNQTRTVDEAGRTIVEPYGGTRFTVVSTGKFISSTGGDSCSSSGVGAAAFVRVTSDVTWDSNRRTHVVQEGIVTPTVGGTLLTNVKDQNNVALSGVTVSAAGIYDSDSGTTDSLGCTLFSSMATGDYYVGATKTGFVDPDGNASPLRGASVSGTGTSFPVPNPFRMGQAGGISANFKTQISGTTYTGQKAPSLAWFNPGMSTSKNNLIAPTGSPPKTFPSAQVNSWVTNFNLYPFTTTGPDVYTDNYTVWAGSCDAAKPPTSQSTATIGPGTWAILNDGGTPVRPRVLMPALILTFNYKNPAGVITNNVQPAAVKLTHDGCAQSWWPEVGPGTPVDPPGVLKFPGQPYAPDVAGQRISVCADYTPDGGANYYRTNAIFEPKTRNDNFTAGTAPPAMMIDATNAWAQGRCPA